ncbi:immunity 26/phosphotriesterase HocA family protein [Anaeromyxobacter oryzisoli]|uniref:immunity 26/phosphotriesterase HocA family protein n=1 Tax=Anaeromyxobacter oryzisoli TaxID=2925408 RepID=UPI001F59FB41|nr:immunity 26/phosphotriesterase HocA family protein [Anaeromyxobacter sp. SG63]
MARKPKSPKASSSNVRRIAYREGDWFLIPLRDGSGFGAGVVARVGRRGVTLGYFFGPKHAGRASLVDVERDAPTGAVLVGKFGDLGLIRGSWPLLGQTPGRWARERWPIPEFVRTDVISGSRRKVIYVEGDLSTETATIPIDARDAADLPADGLMGFGAVEIRLTNLLEGPDREH